MLKKILLCVLLSGVALTVPIDEFRSKTGGEERKFNDDKFLMNIVPSGFSTQKLSSTSIDLHSIIEDKENEHYNKLKQLTESGKLMKGLTFNIYQEEMRDGVIALFRLLQKSNSDDYTYKLLGWAKLKLNKNLVEYVQRLLTLHTKNRTTVLPPPFITKPNHFVNSETIRKAASLMINNGHIDAQEGIVYQISKNDLFNTRIINTNYSGWNSQSNGINYDINYFTEDIGLNSYYYGLHILHPYWMSNEELDEIDPRHADHYYYSHQQLLARLQLESDNVLDTNSNSEYDPNLIHDNGLEFPMRSLVLGDFTKYWSKIRLIDIGIREFISRGFIVLNNEGPINFTETNYVDLIAKLIRANYDGIKNSKLVKSIFGYGLCESNVNRLNPAPSVLHYPETSLRDPLYWGLIRFALGYFTDYQKILKPYNLSEYQTDNFEIININCSRITTYFDYYQLSIKQALVNENTQPHLNNFDITARQRRLQHLPFTLNFNVQVKEQSRGVVRIFIGPECYAEECWRKYNKFFELDSYLYDFESGLNELNWSPNNSSRYSFDDFYNREISGTKDRYNMFKFPENLIIPKGSQTGSNFTLFVMISPIFNTPEAFKTFGKTNFYSQTINVIDGTPRGFPFHRPAEVLHTVGSNYRFFNISIFHKLHLSREYGYFSPNLD